MHAPLLHPSAAAAGDACALIVARQDRALTAAHDAAVDALTADPDATVTTLVTTGITAYLMAMYRDERPPLLVPDGPPPTRGDHPARPTAPTERAA